MSVSEYDLVVIGSGPAGQKAAIAAAKARKRVAIGPGLLFDFCTRSKVDQMGND